MDPLALYDWLTRAGVTGLLAAILYGVHKGWWIPKIHHEAILTLKDREISYHQEEAEEWKQIAKEANGTLGVAVATARQATQGLKG